jgi:hypothetical protein
VSVLLVAAGKAEPALFSTNIGGPGQVHVYLVDGRPVAAGTAGTFGNVVVRLPYTSALASVAATNDGYVNFMAVVGARGRAKPFFFSRTFDRGTWSAGTTPDLPPSLSTAGGTRASQASANNPDAGCTYTVLDSGNADNVVGEIHTPSNTSATLTYGGTSDSDMGVGYSTNGSNWSVSGTIHVGNAHSVVETWARGSSYAHRELSEFHWEERHNHCPAGPTDFYSVQSTAWNGGAVDGAEISSFDHQCDTTYDQYKVPQAPGTDFNRSDKQFVTWSVDTGAFGIRTSAQSGASMWVTIDMQFHQATGTRWICGDDAKPPTARRIFAGVS